MPTSVDGPSLSLLYGLRPIKVHVRKPSVSHIGSPTIAINRADRASVELRSELNKETQRHEATSRSGRRFGMGVCEQH
ncbi:unnamed protein product [Citrullus colocynthis]|uniref:Uncharacterized protein n=1 Tax=Citrullus colocynthis TaxID=252529 RepID=A0ABP0Z6W8_9ROSI